jgi:hypothetical protein
MRAVERLMNLTFLDRFRPQRDLPKPAVFDGPAQVRAYWEGLRLGGAVPPRSAIDPRGLGGVLDRVFLAERIGRGLVQVRIAGSALVEFAGTDLRGLPLGCLFAADSRPQLAITVERVLAEPLAAEIDLGSDRDGGAGPVARLVLLPLAEENGARLLLGAVGFAGPPAARCKFQLRGWREARLMPPPAPDTERPLQPIRRFGHLALVHVGD